MQEIEIGRAKRARRAWSFDDVAIVPSRRTRDPEEVSTAWQIDAYRFEIPVVAAPMDSVMSPGTAVQFGKMGGLGVLDLEGPIVAEQLRGIERPGFGHAYLGQPLLDQRRLPGAQLVPLATAV